MTTKDICFLFICMVIFIIFSYIIIKSVYFVDVNGNRICRNYNPHPDYYMSDTFPYNDNLKNVRPLNSYTSNDTLDYASDNYSEVYMNN